MSGQYILDENGQPKQVDDIIEWSRWFETHPRTIAHDQFSSCRVSTVFLGIDHNFFGGPPLLWETLVFGGPLDMQGDRYASAEDALAGHAEFVARVKAAIGGAS